MTELSFKKNILIKGKIVCETGLHIGGVAESTEIGGTDNPVIIDKLKNVPIIPGSSLKGKIRSLLELEKGLYEEDGKFCKYPCDGGINGKEDKRDLCILFGKGANEEAKIGPTRLIVRDAYPTEETINKWKNNEDLVHGTEIKGENWINRITSQADPRFIERVPAGSEFEFEIICSIYEYKDFNRLKMLFEGMCLLEDNYLGGSGSRGYGKIKFKDLELKEKTKEDYQGGEDWKKVKDAESKTPKNILNQPNILDSPNPESQSATRDEENKS